MKFKLQDRQGIKVMILVLSYIVAVTLAFLGIYTIMESVPPPDSEGDVSKSTDVLDVFSQFYTGTILKKGKENIRAVWIATVSNINYPTKRSLSAAELKAELDAIVERCSLLGANTIFFQVRPCSDALYKSDIFPQSHYVSGKRGEAANENFDSLGYLCEAASAKSISVHAWVNPVRVLSGSQSDTAVREELSTDEPAYKHPEWTVIYADGKMYYDLGIPEVRTLIADGVKEIVSNYKVAGVVFDDYFYPYPTYGTDGKLADFDDAESYNKYGKNKDIGDFRRDNVNSLIRVCHAAVKKADKSALFGISPFGVWRNGESVGGSDTSGLESYSSIYCDTLAFVREGTVDYVAPQLYWEIGNSGYDFIKLSEWWNNALSPYDIPLIPCLAPYRYSEGSYNEGEITKQLRHARSLSNYGGCAMYGYAALTDSRLSVGNEIISLWNKVG